MREATGFDEAQCHVRSARQRKHPVGRHGGQVVDVGVTRRGAPDLVGQCARADEDHVGAGCVLERAKDQRDVAPRGEVPRMEEEEGIGGHPELGMQVDDAGLTRRRVRNNDRLHARRCRDTTGRSTR